MSESQWELVETAPGELQGELLRGLLEAQGIPVILSQEGAGHYAYPVTIGRLGEVQILVPSTSAEQAREVLRAYYAGEFIQTEDFLEPGSDDEEKANAEPGE